VSFSCCCISIVGADVQVGELGAALKDKLELDDDDELKLGSTELELVAAELELDDVELDEETKLDEDVVLELDMEVNGETRTVGEAGVFERVRVGEGLAS
jgi:hypothetical protein